MQSTIKSLNQPTRSTDMKQDTRHPIAVEFKTLLDDGRLPLFEIPYEAAGTIWYLTVDISIYQVRILLELDNLGMPYFSGDWEVEHRYDDTHIVASTALDNFDGLDSCLEEAYAECVQYISDCGFIIAEE